MMNYCIHCEWSANTEDYTRSELSRAAVEHAVETGHDIESPESRDRSSESARTHEQEAPDRPDG